MENTSVRFNLLQALAWRVVAELYRRHAGKRHLRLLETHPGSSMRGQLRLLVSAHTTTAPNKSDELILNLGGPAGTADILRAGTVVLSGFDFAGPMLTDDPVVVVDRLESYLGLPKVRKLPPSTPSVLAVRTIASVLTHEWIAPQTIRGTLGLVDHSSGSRVPAWTAAFGIDHQGLTRAIDSGQQTWEQAYAQVHGFVALHNTTEDSPVLEAGPPFAAFDLQAGRIVLGSKRTAARWIELMPRYQQQAGRRLAPVIDEVLKHLGR